jgi:toxin HigB-1
VIVSFRDEWLRTFFVDDAHSRHIPADLQGRLFRKLQMIDDATTDQDLRVPPSNHYEKLRGNLTGLHSVRVNSQVAVGLSLERQPQGGRRRISRQLQL